MKRLRLLLALGLLLLASTGARALCVGDCSCTASSSGLSFGSINPLSLAPTDGAGTLSVRCSGVLALAVPYRVDFGPGGSGNAAARRLSLGALLLAYNLYTDTSRSVVWGDGSGGTQAVEGTIMLDVAGQAPPQVLWVYGRVPGGQTTAAPGAYSDSVLVTITYY